MYNRIKQLLAPPEFESEEIAHTAVLLNTILIVFLISTLIVPFLTYLINISQDPSLVTRPEQILNLIIGVVMSSSMLGLKYLMHRGYVRAVSWLVSLVLLLGLAFTIYTFNGIRDNVTIAFTIIVAVPTLLLRNRASVIFFSVASILIITIVYFAEIQGAVTYEVRPVGANDLVIYSIIIGLVGVLLRYAMRNLNEALDRARQGEHAVAEANLQLKGLNEDLEQRVADRTKALVISTEVSRRLSTILNRDELVSEVVKQVQEAFGYYHVHIYLFGENNEELVMVGGTGEAGAQMLENGHKLHKSRGMVGRAGSTNTVVLAADVTQNESWVANPLLPETKSEVAVPISQGDYVLGVLDVQDNVKNRIQFADADVIQGIANQVAIALQNAQRYQEAQQQASIEALVNSIGQKIQATTSVDEAMQIAVREVGRAVGTPRTTIRLETGPLSSTGNGRDT
jgi:putative methionine-R-sulfoxide reductase with GAF domain